MINSMNIYDDKLIMVCSECHTACCWYGEFMCDNAKHAKTVIKTVCELKEIKLEHPCYWGDQKLIEIYGQLPDFTEEYKKQVSDEKN
jgi:ribosomal protein L31